MDERDGSKEDPLRLPMAEARGFWREPPYPLRIELASGVGVGYPSCRGRFALSLSGVPPLRNLANWFLLVAIRRMVSQPSGRSPRHNRQPSDLEDFTGQRISLPEPPIFGFQGTKASISPRCVYPNTERRLARWILWPPYPMSKVRGIRRPKNPVTSGGRYLDSTVTSA